MNLADLPLIGPEDLLTGDCLVHRRGKWSLIGIWTPWVHVDAVGVLYGRPCAFGATVPRVTYLLVERLLPTKHTIIALRPVDPPVSPQVDILTWLLDQGNYRKYTVSMLGRLSYLLPLGLRPVGKEQTIETAGRDVICSSWVNEFYERWFDFDVSVVDDRYTIPADFLVTPRLRSLGVLV